MFYAHVQQCEAKLTEASAALVTLAEEVTALRAAGAQECEAAVAELLASTGQLQEAFEFVDVLAHNVRAATALVDATERRLDTLEAGLTLPRAIAQLPPVQFEAHQFAQQLQRRECATIPELPELSELASRAERAAQVPPNPNPTWPRPPTQPWAQSLTRLTLPSSSSSRSMSSSSSRWRETSARSPARPTARLPTRTPARPNAPRVRRPTGAERRPACLLPLGRRRLVPPTSRVRCKKRRGFTRVPAASSSGYRSR